MSGNKQRKGYPFRALLTQQLTGISEPEGQGQLWPCRMNEINQPDPRGNPIKIEAQKHIAREAYERIRASKMRDKAGKLNLSNNCRRGYIRTVT